MSGRSLLEDYAPREGLAPSDDNRRRTFGELMNLLHARYGSRLHVDGIEDMRVNVVRVRPEDFNHLHR